MTVAAFGNATVTLGANNTINAGSSGIYVQGHGTGSINISTATKDDQSGSITAGGFLGDGILAQQGFNTATGGIKHRLRRQRHHHRSFFGGSGIVASIQNAADTSGMHHSRGQRHPSSQGVGIPTPRPWASGDITVTTLKGTRVSSFGGDGIDAFGMGGGNVTVTLLDGSVNSNTSGSAALFPSGGATGPAPSGPPPKLISGSATPADPHGVYMITVAGGAATAQSRTATSPTSAQALQFCRPLSMAPTRSTSTPTSPTTPTSSPTSAVTRLTPSPAATGR